MNFNNVSFECAFGTSEQLVPSTVPEICFSGRSNVGKSSLINKILGRKSIARVSSTPGKTVTINFYRLNEFRLVDLPGYGYAKVSQSEKNRWSQLIDGYFAQNRDIRLVVMLVDSRHKPSKDDLTMLDFLEESGLPTLIALTKVDKLNKTERTNRLAALPDELGCDEEMLLPFSSVTGEGAEQLREILYQVVADEEE